MCFFLIKDIFLHQIFNLVIVLFNSVIEKIFIITFILRLKFKEKTPETHKIQIKMNSFYSILNKFE